ncbi:hypothetical protein HZB60_08345 [candidate division KSB1 bacterium]|nr:hypothetical protein [candidate division KSB1 bacterium]
MFSRIVILVSVLGLVETSLADRRNFVWTYQYQTMPAEATELEFYQTTRLNDVDRWEYRFEVEHGLTDRWDFSVYQIFAQLENQDLKWDAVQFRTRYRIGEEGQYPLDPLLYLEYNRPTSSHRPNKYEVKLIAAKTAAPWLIAFNPVYELFAGPDTKHELGLDAAACYEFSPRLSLGLESTTRVEFEEGETVTASYAGPTVSIASGTWWYSLGGALRVSTDGDDARVRFLMGVGL